MSDQLSQYAENFSINQMPGYCHIMTIDSKYFHVNNKALSMIGYAKPDQIMGKSYDIMRCQASESAEFFTHEDNQTIQQQGSVKIISYHSYAADNWIILFGEKAPVYSKQGIIIGTMAHFMDITRLNLVDISRFLIDSNKRYSAGIKRRQFSYIIQENFTNNLLSRRQSECLFYFIRGKTIKGIAEILKLSPRTVEEYLNQVKLKFNCQTKPDLIEAAIQLGYLNYIPGSLIAANR